MELSETGKRAKENLERFQGVINPLLKKYFEKETKRVKKEYNDFSHKGIKIFEEITMRDAKRLRASFVYYSHKIFGAPYEKAALQAGVALELIHAYLLVVDDFMDLSDRRRGDLTAHKLFSKMHEEEKMKNDPVHFGYATAVTTGLIGCHMALKIMDDLEIPAELIVKATANINKQIITTGYGQLNDVINEAIIYPSEKDVVDVLNWKTAAYTYENPIHLGAILGGASDKDLIKLSQYSTPAGIAFQIQDDILGTFGDEERTGKSNMDDLKEGKYTLLVHKAIEKANKKDKAHLEAALGNKNLTKDEHQVVQKIMVDTGSFDYSKDIALKFVIQAKNSLIKNFNNTDNNEGLNYLEGIADYMINRKL